MDAGRDRPDRERARQRRPQPARPLAVAAGTDTVALMGLVANAQRHSNPLTDLANMQALRDSGLEEEEIAAQVGVSVVTVRRRLRC